jgi:hypothetical protein
MREGPEGKRSAEGRPSWLTCGPPLGGRSGIMATASFTPSSKASSSELEGFKLGRSRTDLARFGDGEKN